MSIGLIVEGVTALIAIWAIYKKWKTQKLRNADLKKALLGIAGTINLVKTKNRTTGKVINTLQDAIKYVSTGLDVEGSIVSNIVDQIKGLAATQGGSLTDDEAGLLKLVTAIKEAEEKKKKPKKVKKVPVVTGIFSVLLVIVLMAGCFVGCATSQQRYTTEMILPTNPPKLMVVFPQVIQEDDIYINTFEGCPMVFTTLSNDLTTTTTTE